MQAPASPPALMSFGHIRRVWNAEQQATVATLLPGQYYVTRHDELIFTVLGSCVSACVREPLLGIGGMNHFLLPHDCTGGSADRGHGGNRYGIAAMDNLIGALLQLGGKRENLEFKVVGGGAVLDVALDVGALNTQFVLEYLRRNHFAASVEDLGGRLARKIFYSPRTGDVRVKYLSRPAYAAP